MSKISELSDGGVIQGGDTLIAVRSGGNVKVTYGGTTTANIDGGTIDGTVIGGTTAAAGSFTTGSFTGDVSFGDSDKAVFGAGSDLQIYHDGGNSRILENGTGFLAIGTNGGEISLRGDSFNDYMLKAEQNSAVTLYHNALPKLATTSTGIDVTGSVVSDGLTVSTTGTTGGTITTADYGTFDLTNGTSTVRLQNNNSIPRVGSATNHPFVLASNEVQRIRLDTNGDISFYEDTGTTAKLTWSAASERLTLKTSGSTALDVQASANTSATMAQFSNNNGSDKAYIALDSTGAGKIVLLDGGNNEDVLIQASGTSYYNTGGNFLIGKTSTDLSEDGIELRDVGLLAATRSSNLALLLRRNTNDGDLVQFQKDSTTVGSIGSVAGQDIVIGSGSAGLRFLSSGPAIQPRNSNGNANNDAIDIGLSGNRFKDLHLSGSVKVPAASKGIEYSSTSFITPENNTSGAEISTAGTLTVKTGSTPSLAMTVDGSGSLLVGTTSSRPAEFTHPDGFAVRADVKGQIQNTVTNAQCAIFNRDGTDGEMLLFRKEGTSVGSIQSRAGVVSTIILDPRSGQGAGLTGAGAGGDFIRHINPTAETGVETDGKVSLGKNSVRFMDLYLSGGVYLGGTGSSNHLDDYETGTWTPVLKDSGNGAKTLTTAEGKYIKVGSKVTIWFNVVSSNNLSDTNYNQLQNLPFTPSSDQANYRTLGFAHVAQTTNNRGVPHTVRWFTGTTAFLHCFHDGTTVNAAYSDEISGCFEYFV